MSQQTDKERILMTLLTHVAQPSFSDYDKKQGFPRVEYGEPVKGDLVIAQSSGAHPYAVGWAVTDFDSSGFGHLRVRELGSERECDISNDRFLIVRDLNPDLLLEGPRRVFHRKVLKAFRRGDEYNYRYGGIDFGDGLARGRATVWIREAFGGLSRPSEPFSVMIGWSSRTTIKSVLAAMRAVGYGTRKFGERTGKQ